MAIVTSPKLIKSNDFPPDQEQTITSLGNILNPTLEQLYAALNGGLDFNNLNQLLISFPIKVDADGIPKSKIEIKSSLKTKIQGVICIRAIGTSFPTGNPLISFTYSSSTNSISIDHITSLVPNIQYTLTVILVG